MSRLPMWTARRQRRWPRGAGFQRWLATAEEVIGDPKVEAVLICTPTGTHADLIVQAAKAGKQIFCEKPIAFSLDKIDMALEAVKKAGVKLQIGFNRRFDSNFRRVRTGSGEGGDRTAVPDASSSAAIPRRRRSRIFARRADCFST